MDLMSALDVCREAELCLINLTLGEQRCRSAASARSTLQDVSLHCDHSLRLFSCSCTSLPR